MTLPLPLPALQVLIENGTKEGHQILMEAREAVLKGKDEDSPGHVFAPCPHDGVCPKLTAAVPVPCNFTQAYHPLPFSWVSVCAGV
ncbi:methyltransferase-like protein 17, mitochondrial [Chiloscyllium plagiosum]|uniref:methyltransferase-like protein 17, mitochondrial n=1 Tax=Chiloscyllium plagiosum TaxID=36176 RepID=UPI001CB83B7C|nr:methyltransferase-like protein 17, mitochondrial [Chiloscyllium plagiosum]